MCIFLIPFSQAALWDNLEYYWGFENNSDLTGTQDLFVDTGTVVNISSMAGTGYNHSIGALTRTAAHSPPGIFDDYFTVNIWTNFSYSGTNGFAISKYTSAVPGQLVFVISFFADNRPFAQSDVDGVFETVSATTALQNNTWNMITYSYNRTGGALNQKIYVNGALEGTTDTPESYVRYANNSHPISFARYTSANSNQLNGSVDETAIWSRVLTDTEVTQLYNSGNGNFYLHNLAVNAPTLNATPKVHTNVTINCTGGSPRFNTTWNYSVNNINDSYENVSTEPYYHFNNSDFFDHLVYTCIGYSVYNWTNNSAQSSEGTIDADMTVNALNSNGDLITNAQIDFLNSGLSYFSNPLTLLMSTFVSIPDRTAPENIWLTDFNLTSFIPAAFERQLNESHLIHNLTMNWTMLNLRFYDGNDLKITNGSVLNPAENYSIYNFNASSITLYNVNFTNNEVIRVALNFNQTTYGQYYEYINTLSTHVNESMQILDNLDGNELIIRVVDEGKQPIENAIVTALLMNRDIGYNRWNDSMMFGQRVTDSDGIARFKTEENSLIGILVTRTGYVMEPFTLQEADTEYSLTSPLIIVMETSTSGALNGLVHTLPRRTNDTTIQINFSVGLRNANSIKFNTSHYTTFTQMTKENYRWVWDRELIPGTHFVSGTTNDIIIHIYVDDVFNTAWTIQYDNTSKTEIFDYPDSLSSTYVIPIVWILVILLAWFSQYIFRSETTTNKTGPLVFKVGCIIAAFISSSFLWLSVLVMFGFVMLGLKKVFSE